MNTVVVQPTGIAPADVAAVARGDARVVLAESTVDAMTASRSIVERIEESGPKVIQHGSRPHLRTELSTSVDSSGHLHDRIFARHAHLETQLLTPVRSSMDGGL